MKRIEQMMAAVGVLVVGVVSYHYGYEVVFWGILTSVLMGIQAWKSTGAKRMVFVMLSVLFLMTTGIGTYQKAYFDPCLLHKEERIVMFSSEMDGPHFWGEATEHAIGDKDLLLVSGLTDEMMKRIEREYNCVLAGPKGGVLFYK